MSFLVGALLLSIVTAVACALPGVFVVLRGNSMLVDAISHAILPGIILGYVFTRDFDSPLLVLGAALAGLVVVLGSELLHRTGLLAGDASQGLVFPALFSVGVIMVTLGFAHVHLDTHTVLAGDLNLAALQPLVIGGVNIGPSYLYLMLAVLAVNGTFVSLLYSRLKVTTFDPAFARSIGIRTGVLNTVFMFLVSVTVTASFNAAGSILVIALVVVPAATAILFTTRLSTLIVAAIAIAIVGSAAGFWSAYLLGAPTSAAMATFYGLIFLVAFGLVRASQAFRQRRAGRSAQPRTEVRDRAHA